MHLGYSAAIHVTQEFREVRINHEICGIGYSGAHRTFPTRCTLEEVISIKKRRRRKKGERGESNKAKDKEPCSSFYQPPSHPLSKIYINI